MKRLILLMLLSLSSCTNSNDGYKALTSMGFTEIEFTGYSFWGCSEDDFYHTGFRAKNPQGMIVTGTVCSGFLFKKSTVRF